MPANSNSNKVSPFVWFFLLVAILCDAAKILCLFLNALPGVGTAIDAGLSFIISIIEITIVFGGLWFVGIYKPGTSTYYQNLLVTLGVSAVDLVPIIDDIPFTSPVVFFMIVRAYIERSKLGQAVAITALGAATGGAALAAEGAAAKAGASTAQKVQAATHARQGSETTKGSTGGGQNAQPATGGAHATMPTHQDQHGQGPVGEPYYFPGPEKANDNEPGESKAA